MRMICAGPGKAWSALEQGEYLFRLAERKPSFIKVPVALMDGIIGFLDLLAKVFPGLEVSCCLLSTHASDALMKACVATGRMLSMF